MRVTRRFLKLPTVALLLGALALAGCAEPEEAAEDDAEDVGVETVGFGPVVIDGWVYECDDTINLDETCDEYVWSEDAAAPADAPQLDSAGETVEIGGRTFECDDTFNIETTGDEPMCEEYELAE